MRVMARITNHAERGDNAVSDGTTATSKAEVRLSSNA
jgi:hypothetical protein